VDPAKPQDAKGVVKVDMNQVRTGIDKRDVRHAQASRTRHRHRSEPLGSSSLEGRDIGTTGAGKEAPAKIHGVLTVKQKPVDVSPMRG